MAQCGIKYWQAVGEVVLLRCSNALDDDGNAPKPDVVNTEGINSLKDTDAILAAIAAQDWIQAAGAWTPQGPNGGCSGIMLNFNFNLDQPS